MRVVCWISVKVRQVFGLNGIGIGSMLMTNGALELRLGKGLICSKETMNKCSVILSPWVPNKTCTIHTSTTFLYIIRGIYGLGSRRGVRKNSAMYRLVF